MASRYRETYNPSYGTRAHFSEHRRFGTSPVELLHLAAATAVLTTAIVLWFTYWEPDMVSGLDLYQLILVSLGVVLTGFVLHEVAHKITAQHYGHWSEFRSSVGGLAITVAVAAFLHILFGAPGATWHTATSVRDNGKISAAGPLTNLVMALVAFPFTEGVTGRDDFLSVIARMVLLFNTFLAIFNLVPLGPLDGRKILRWSPVIYIVLVGLTVLLVVYAKPFEGVF